MICSNESCGFPVNDNKSLTCKNHKVKSAPWRRGTDPNLWNTYTYIITLYIHTSSSSSIKTSRDSEKPSRGCHDEVILQAEDFDLSRIDHITWTSSYPHAITSPWRSIIRFSCSAQSHKNNINHLFKDNQTLMFCSVKMFCENVVWKTEEDWERNLFETS